MLVTKTGVSLFYRESSRTDKATQRNADSKQIIKQKCIYICIYLYITHIILTYILYITYINMCVCRNRLFPLNCFCQVLDYNNNNYNKYRKLYDWI